MRNIIEKHLKANARNYIFLLLILFLGIIIGVVIVNNTKNETKEELNIFISDFINSIKDNKSIDYWKTLKKSIKRNTKYIVLITVISFSIWRKVGNTILIGYKGFGIGYSISTVLTVLGNEKGFLFSLTLLLISQIFLIPVFMYTAVNSMNTYKEIIESNNNCKKVLIIKNIFNMIIAIFFAIFSAFIQTFLCSNLFLLFVKYY